MYAANNNGNNIIRNKDELVTALKNLLEEVKEFLMSEQINIDTLLQVPNEQKLLLIEKYSNKIVGQQERRNCF